jgi:hypothetical protein
MSACEYCWERSSPVVGYDYSATVLRAEEEGWPCTKNDEEGARLRAGQFWDEATKSDRRTSEKAPLENSNTAAELCRGGKPS